MIRPLSLSALLLALLPALSSGAQPSIFGATGTGFVPGGFVSERRVSISSGGALQEARDLRFFPYHLSGVATFLGGSLEVSVANTASFVRGDSLGFRTVSTVVPVIPGVKYALAVERSPRQKWGYAVGFLYPYGAYVAASWQRRMPLLSPEATIAFSTPIRTLYAMGGLRLVPSTLAGDPLPLGFVLDGAYAGSTERIGEKEEAFVSAGVETALGRAAALGLFWRRDVTYSAAENRQNNDGKLQLRLNFSFDGIKTTSAPQGTP